MAPTACWSCSARCRPDLPAAFAQCRVPVYYQVETLIFGRAVERATQPERFIVGCLAPDKPLDPRFAALLGAFDCPILPMRYESAELAKISINMCLVASDTVANTLAELCERIGADWSEIVPALKLDRRIGRTAISSPDWVSPAAISNAILRRSNAWRPNTKPMPCRAGMDKEQPSPEGLGRTNNPRCIARSPSRMRPLPSGVSPTKKIRTQSRTRPRSDNRATERDQGSRARSVCFRLGHRAPGQRRLADPLVAARGADGLRS